MIVEKSVPAFARNALVLLVGEIRDLPSSSSKVEMMACFLTSVRWAYPGARIETLASPVAGALS